MMEILNWLFGKLVVFVAFLNTLVIVKFNGNDITLLGFIGALIIVAVAIKILMPKAH